MKSNTSTHVNNIVVLVTDKFHQRRGEIGKMLYHSRLEDGAIRVKYSDGAEETFYDEDKPERIHCFYRKRDKTTKLYDKKNKGPKSFIRAISRIKTKDLEYFSEQYEKLFGEKLPN